MKKTITTLVLSTALGAGLQAAPFLAVGDNAELFLTGSGAVKSDSNIYLSSSGDSDTILEFKPGVELVFGKNAVTKGSLTLAETFTSYQDHDDLNTELFSGYFNANYDDGKTKITTAASYVETNQNTVDNRSLDALIRKDATGASAKGEVSVSDKSSVEVGVDYKKADYKRVGFVDTDEILLPFRCYYEATPKVDLSLGYQYRATWLDEGSGTTALNRHDSTDHFFSLGARGDFTPKLSGAFDVGYAQRKYDTLGDRSLLGISSSFTYEVSPKTKVRVGISNDFGVNSQGQEQKNFTVSSGLIFNLSEEWTVNADLIYRTIGYYSRTDDYVDGSVGTTYAINAYVKIGAAYNYKHNASDQAASEFTGNLFTLSASVRY